MENFSAQKRIILFLPTNAYQIARDALATGRLVSPSCIGTGSPPIPQAGLTTFCFLRA